jgi:hypothetical protein
MTPPLKTCKNLWFPISELPNKDSSNLMLASPKLVDDDFNPHGVSQGHWEPLGWVVIGWDCNNDEPVKVVLNEEDVTHFMYVEGPYPGKIVVKTLDDFEKYSASWIRQLAIDKQATYLKHHECSLCGAPVGYVIYPISDTVLWNGNCGCGGWSGLRGESFETIALFLKMQSSDEIRDKILEGFS